MSLNETEEQTSYNLMMMVLDDCVRVAHEAMQLIEEQADVACQLDADGKCALSKKLTEVMQYHQKNESAARQFEETYCFEKHGIEMSTRDSCFYAKREAPASFTKVVLDAWRDVANSIEFSLQYADQMKGCKGLCQRSKNDNTFTVEEVSLYLEPNMAEAKAGIAKLVALRDQVAGQM